MKSWQLPGERRLGEKRRGDVYLKQPCSVVPRVQPGIEWCSGWLILFNCTSCPGYFFKKDDLFLIIRSRLYCSFFSTVLGSEGANGSDGSVVPVLCSRCRDFIIHHLRHKSGLSHQLLWLNLKKFKYEGLPGVVFEQGRARRRAKEQVLEAQSPRTCTPEREVLCARPYLPPRRAASAPACTSSCLCP